MCSTCERIKVELRSLYQKRAIGLIDDIPELVPDEFNQHISTARAARMDYRADQLRFRDGLISHWAHFHFHGYFSINDNGEFAMFFNKFHRPALK